MIDRRLVLRGLGAAGLCAGSEPAWAGKPAPDPEEQLFQTGPLAQNAIGAMFTVPRKRLVWPARTYLFGPDGKRRDFRELQGKLLLVDLWAEWCTPCLRELAGIAYQRSQVSNDKFEIVAINTGTSSYRKPSDAMPLLRKIGAPGLDTWLDLGNGPTSLIDSLCFDARSGGSAVPCMLIIDQEFQIRGRVLGGFDVKVETGPGAGHDANAWSTTMSTKFVTALANGVLPGV